VEAEIARDVNLEMRRVAELLPADPKIKHPFVCEDGCEATVWLTLSEYDANGGAWLDGHR